ncbi:RadC family protein [Myxococcota bacterium]
MPIRRKLENQQTRKGLHRRLSIYGARNISDTCLLTAMLSGNARSRRQLAESLLQRAESIWELSHFGLATLRACGLSQTDSLRLKASMEIGRRALVEPIPSHAVREPRDAYLCVAGQLAGEERECFMVVVLDVKNRPRHVAAVAEGSVDLCHVDPREVFVAALRQRGSGVIIAHNHPSGDPTPSSEDLLLTERLVEAGVLLGIPVLDHIIVGRKREGDVHEPFVSLAERGLMPGFAK